VSSGPRYDREYVLLAGRVVARSLDPFIDRLGFVGSFRRGLPTCGDIDILTIPRDGVSQEQCNRAFESVCLSRRLESEGSGLSVGMVSPNEAQGLEAVPVNVFYTVPEEWGAALMYTTGSKAFNLKYRSIAKARGFKVSQYGVFDRNDNPIPDSGFSERAVCRTIGIPWLPPRFRDGKRLSL